MAQIAVPNRLRYPHPPDKTYDTQLGGLLERRARDGAEKLESTTSFLSDEFPGIATELMALANAGDELAIIYVERLQIALHNLGDLATNADGKDIAI